MQVVVEVVQMVQMEHQQTMVEVKVVTVVVEEVVDRDRLIQLL